MYIGLISDTHGLLRPEALDALRGCAHIVHAGDIGRAEVIAGLRALAAVTAVGGNNDAPGAWPETATVELGGRRLLVLHDVAALTAVPAGTDIVVYGHSHRPEHGWRDGVLFVNPGSAGPRRFKLPVSLARLRLDAGALEPEFVRLLP